MRGRCDTGIQYALVKDAFEPETLKRQVEQQLKAAEERNKLFLQNAARRDIDAYVTSTCAIKAKPSMALPQLSLNFDRVADSKEFQSAAPFA